MRAAASERLKPELKSPKPRERLSLQSVLAQARAEPPGSLDRALQRRATLEGGDPLRLALHTPLTSDNALMRARVRAQAPGSNLAEPPGSARLRDTNGCVRSKPLYLSDC